MGPRVLGLVGSGAGGVEELLPCLIRPAQEAGWTVTVTLTPTAARWLRESGTLAEIEEVSGFPVRVDPHSPTERSPHPQVDCYLVAPASANTIAKLALGIYDNQALTQVNEAIGIPDLPGSCFPASTPRTPGTRHGTATLRPCAGPVCILSTARTYGRCTSRGAHRGVNCPGQWCSTRERGRSRRALGPYWVYPDNLSTVTEYQSQEDKARNRPVRPRVDEVTGCLLFLETFADPSVEKDREKSVMVEFACADQPVPPEAMAGLPFRPVVLEGMTVQPRAEASVQW